MVFLCKESKNLAFFCKYFFSLDNKKCFFFALHYLFFLQQKFLKIFGKTWMKKCRIFYIIKTTRSDCKKLSGREIQTTVIKKNLKKFLFFCFDSLFRSLHNFFSEFFITHSTDTERFSFSYLRKFLFFVFKVGDEY